MLNASPERITSIKIEDEMRTSYISYAMSVIIQRALPDVRDGLKPVHRRVIYAMRGLSLGHRAAFKKCAAIVGDTMGKYHPHGDSAIYDTLVRMAQDFAFRYPLVDGQGNFGSVDGDSAAAMRYTEARMAEIAETLLTDIEKQTVDFMPNYDGSQDEPLVLPAEFPNLLVNGGTGIAVGMATNIPPHNLGEIIDATTALIDNPDLETRDLFKYVQGPDFPTGACICGKEGIYEAYSTGRGRAIVRAIAKREILKGNREAIVVTEIPYMVNKARVLEEIARLVRDKKIEGISDLRDESDRDGMRMVIELKRGENHEVVLNQLYKHTRLQSTFGIILLALVNARPRYLTLERSTSGIHQTPPGSHCPPDTVRFGQSRETRPYRRGPANRGYEYRRGRRDNSQQPKPGRSLRPLKRTLRPFRRANEGHSRNAVTALGWFGA